MSITENWSRENLAWLAGIIEGEGSIHVGPGALVLVVSMSDEDVVRKAAWVAGCGHLAGPLTRASRPNHKPQFKWRVSRAAHVYALIVEIYPWMHARRRARIEGAIGAFRFKRRGSGRTHGKVATYRRGGCRCDRCGAAASAANQDYRSRKKLKADAGVIRIGTCPVDHPGRSE